MDYAQLNKLAGEVVEQDYHREHSEPDYVDDMTELSLSRLSSGEREQLTQCMGNWEVNPNSEQSSEVYSDELINRMNASD